VDWLVALVLLALMVVSIATKQPAAGQRAGNAAAYLLSAGMALPFAVHRRYPMTALTVTLASLLAYSMLDEAAFPGLNLFVLLCGIALHSDRRRALVALVASLAAMSVALAVQPAGVVNGSTWTSTLLATAVAWLTGDSVRNRRARWAAMEERARRLEHDREEQARQAVAAERLRIARELHDVVAHSMSVIAVQAGVGHHVIDTDPVEAGRALATIETTSRAALTEMRRLLGVLRPDGDLAASLSPAPGLADVPDLVGQVAEAGVRVDVSVEGDPRPLPPGVDLSAYRIVQEALTNVIKHGGPQAAVTVRYDAECVAVEVVDLGRPDGTGPAAVPAGTGHGIIGMRERVAVFGGELTAARRPGGGFRVAARLPSTPVQP
jgi:signal transduction histidine kinase